MAGEEIISHLPDLFYLIDQEHMFYDYKMLIAGTELWIFLKKKEGIIFLN